MGLLSNVDPHKPLFVFLHSKRKEVACCLTVCLPNTYRHFNQHTSVSRPTKCWSYRSPWFFSLPLFFCEDPYDLPQVGRITAGWQ